MCWYDVHCFCSFFGFIYLFININSPFLVFQFTQNEGRTISEPVLISIKINFHSVRNKKEKIEWKTLDNNNKEKNKEWKQERNKERKVEWCTVRKIPAKSNNCSVQTVKILISYSCCNKIECGVCTDKMWLHCARKIWIIRVERLQALTALLNSWLNLLSRSISKMLLFTCIFWIYNCHSSKWNCSINHYDFHMKMPEHE